MLSGLQSLHLSLWLLRDVCFVDKGSLPLSGSDRGDSRIYIKGVPAVGLEGMDLVVC